MKPKSPEKPRRNLTHAFEALCVSAVSPEETEKEEKSDVYEMVSPTGVADLEGSPTELKQHTESNDYIEGLPEVKLHPDLRRELTAHCILRISCYSILHDINKEAISMAAHDPLLCPDAESVCPLVLAGKGQPSIPPPPGLHVIETPEQAAIDEEKWLLAVIADRSSQETSAVTSTQCPATFLQAMGEKEYDTPAVHSTTSGHSRTQLWKPSRSWWEAKSGKNPWIEPSSHNKRWRYLWPLIHYHKFLAKCIKKLKRNGVDVKHSVSPVSVFLREEVCAVSDHLAAVSLFGSDEWMDCLRHFNGWTVLTATAVQQYQRFVASVPLRSFVEPGDVDSPLLRNQIDEAFLRSVAAQREHLRENGQTVLSVAPSVNGSLSKATVTSQPTAALTAAGLSHQHGGPPPVYPRSLPVPRQINGVRRPRYYPNGWYGWENVPQDTSSVHSELSANSFPQPPLFDPNNSNVAAQYHQPMYPHHACGYYLSQMQPPTLGASASSDHSHSTGAYSYPDQYGGWMDPAMAYAMHHHHHQQFYGPSSPYQPHELSEPLEVENSTVAAAESTETPFKYDPESSNSMSPYWSHLDQATLAMGLATPAKVSPSTPRRRHSNKQQHEEEVGDDEYPGFNNNIVAQAPLIRQQYYGYDAVAPSPATQFMMSPQASFAYNYGYGFSPTRGLAVTTRRNSARKAAATTPIKPVERPRSPTHTVETTATETTESLSTEQQQVSTTTSV